MLHNGLKATALVLALAAGPLSFAGPALTQGAADGRYNVQPPEGYTPSGQSSETSPRARAEDERYSYEAERWARQNCVAERANNTTAGAVIGGLLGAVAGAGLAGRYDRGAGALAGGALGAVAGGTLGNAATDPGCPPGYVLQPHATAFAAGPVYPDVVYVAPGWYDPWIWYGGHWIYRPYPYHRYWFHIHHR
jgi:hypothetical protein